jgi:pimeloyl-ACP methyl ester carboxylesterase
LITDRQQQQPGAGSNDTSAVVLLHGQPGSARDWDRVVAALDADVQPVAVDRPGWDGRSQAQDLPGNAQAVFDLLDARGIERATLVGHSLGAAIAVWAAVEHPERVAALVLAAPAANRASLATLDRWLALPVAGSLASAVSMTGLGLALSASPVRRRIVRGVQLEDAYLEASARILLSGWGRRAFVTEQRSLVRDLPVLEGRLSAVRAPTWIVTGAEDRIVSPDAARRLAAQIPGATLVPLTNAGHLLPQLHAQRLVDAVMLALATAAAH